MELSLDEDYIDEAMRRMQARTLGAGSAALEGQAVAELVSGEEFDDEDDYEAVAIVDTEVVYDPAEMIPVMFDKLITEEALRTVYDEAKKLELTQPDVFAALGVKEAPLKEVYYSAPQCISALHLYRDTCFLGGISHATIPEAARPERGRHSGLDRS